MADVYDYITLTGVIVPDTSEIQTEVQNEFKAVFGADLSVAPNTPQGLLITGEVLSRTAVADNNATLANQINPNLAGGIFLDAIMALTGSQRTPASYTQVVGNLTGVAGSIIPSGSQVRDTVHGELFQALTSVTLAVDGTGSVTFQAINAGAFTVAASTLTQIVTGVLGWETVTNPAIQIQIGAVTQSDESARLYRRNTLAAQGTSLAEAITSALYAVPGVTSLSFRENIATTTQVIDGITMVGHSIYACVDGGSDVDVANALVAKKSGGAAYNNGASSSPVSYSLVVSFSGQTMIIKFDRPDSIGILIRATVSVNSSLQNPVTVVKAAIMQYVNGLTNGEPGFVVGNSVSCFELAGAVNIYNPSIFVHNMETSLITPVSYSNAEIPIALWQKATVLESDISVVLV